MANWIKVDVNTPYKDGIDFIMGTAGVDRGTAFLAWFNLYVFFDAQTSTGEINITREEVDQRAGLKGVADALSSCGWLQFRGRKCHITNWQEHNGSSARARSERMSELSRLRWHPSPPMRHG